MKRIHVILTRINGDEMLRITEPLFIGVVADRFVIDDQRGPIEKRDPVSKRRQPSRKSQAETK